MMQFESRSAHRLFKRRWFFGPNEAGEYLRATMLLPGRLKDTTLGDLLGALCRAKATGKLTLLEDRGAAHQIVVRDGLVHEVETSRGPRLGEILNDAEKYGPEAAQLELRLGEYLLRSGHVTQERLTRALRQLHLLKLDSLFSLKDASIRFHIARPQVDDPAAGPALEPQMFLEGRPRKRGGSASRRREPSRSEALRVFGLSESATEDEIRHSFRTLAQRCHPDRNPGLSSPQRIRLLVEFSELSHAYHSLVG